MRLTFLAIGFGLASITCAQLQGLPTCAQTCVTSFTTGSSIGGCPSLDIKCICSSSDFLSGIACCLAGQCNAADQETAVQFAQNFCKTSGVTNLPSAVSCASTASATGTSATSGSSGTSANSATSATSATSAPSAATTASAFTTSRASTSATASATGNTGAQNLAGIRAGILGGLAAVILM